jgi:hypothetical protein
VIASAYRYARGEGEMPAEMELMRMIDRFGAGAVFGRTLKRGEMRRMVISERIVSAYGAMSAAEDLDGWIKAHPEEWKLIDYAAGLVQ